MSFLRSLFSFRGRTGRLFYWLFFPVHAAIYGTAAILFYFATGPYIQQGSAYGGYVILAFLLGTAVLFIPAAAVATRRLHDRGRSGWWLVLGLALALLAIATVLKYAPSFNYTTLHLRNFFQFVAPLVVTAMLGFVPWSVAVLVFSRGGADYSYLVPALFGVGPLLGYGLWFLIDVGLRRGDTGANAYGVAPAKLLGSDNTGAVEAGSGKWLPIGGAVLAAIAGIVLLSGVLESHTMPCDMAQAIIPNTPSAAREFEDCFDVKGKRACAPRMVVIPAGSFQMGSEMSMDMPIHTVTFAKPFALGKFEVTVAQWEACVAGGGCTDVNPETWQPRSRDVTGSRCRKPAGSNWDRITTEYLPWLARMTGKAYRLPSESEWEYAARAGTTTKFPTGDQISPEYENYDDATPGRHKTIKGNWIDVGSLKPNPFGLYDTVGNSDEWVADIFNFNNYERAPADGSAWTQAMQQSIVGDMRVVRGGHWATKPDVLSVTMRKGNFPKEGGAGFRVALSNPDGADEESCSSVDVAPPAIVAACTRIIDGPTASGLSRLRLAFFYKSRGYALVRLQRPDEALADFQWALKNSDDTFLNIQTGNIYLARKDYQKALDAFDAVKSLGFVDAQVLGRAQALEGLGRQEDAIAEYEKYEKAYSESGTVGAGQRQTANEALIRLGARTAPEPESAPTSPAANALPCAKELQEDEKWIAQAAAVTKSGDAAAACALIKPMATASYVYCACKHGEAGAQLGSCLEEDGKPTLDLKKKFNCP